MVHVFCYHKLRLGFKVYVRGHWLQPCFFVLLSIISLVLHRSGPAECQGTFSVSFQFWGRKWDSARVTRRHKCGLLFRIMCTLHLEWVCIWWEASKRHYHRGYAWWTWDHGYDLMDLLIIWLALEMQNWTWSFVPISLVELPGNWHFVFHTCTGNQLVIAFLLQIISILLHIRTHCTFEFEFYIPPHSGTNMIDVVNMFTNMDANTYVQKYDEVYKHE